MKNFFYKKIILFFLLFIFIIFNDIIYALYISSLKITYFNQNKYLYYVNVMNNEKGDLYMEFWGEINNLRYFIGLNKTTGEEIYFGDEKIYQIEANSASTYHESIIINNGEDNIFSLNSENLNYINLKNREFSSSLTKDLIFENKGDPSSKNCIIKLKNNDYLLSLILYSKGLLSGHHIFFQIFSFIDNNINGFKKISEKEKTIGYLNSTNCFQTENEYIECSFAMVLPVNGFAIGIYNLDFKEYSVQRISYVKDYTFNKIFHFKKEIGIYLYFDKDTDVPRIQIKKLNVENNYKLESLFDFDSIPINGNGKYVLNYGLFYSDGIKINDSKIIVIMTTRDLLNLLICIFDLYNEDTSFRLSYYNLDINQINVKISVNMRGFKFANFFGIIFYNQNLEFPGYIIFNFPNFISDNNYINNTIKEIKLFVDSSTSNFNISENLQIVNNIFGQEIEGIKIINYSDKSKSGVLMRSFILNREITINDEIQINDIIIFEPSLTGAIPGKYILEFYPIIKESTNEIFESLSDTTEFYGNIDENYFYQPKKFNGNILKIIYIVECYEKCKTCNQFGSDSFYYCIECKDEYPYNINNGEKCENICDNFIYIENKVITCVENCNDDQIKFIKNNNEKYCLSSDLYNKSELYIDEENNIYYENCYDNINGNIYIFQKKCVSQCPDNYSINSNNECIFDEKEILLSDSNSAKILNNKINTENEISSASNNINIEIEDSLSNSINNTEFFIF